ncbi:MAG: carboxypeptidase-like regulatory domain-containing protein, partial [Oscillospiraceae bacterium]
VTLTCQKCGKVMETETDFFGDFEFKYLVKGNTYTIRAEVPGYKAAEVTVTLDEAKNLGVITLEKA